MIALSVAGVLAVFLLYTSIAGGGTPQLTPSQLPGHQGKVSLVGEVVGPVTGDAHGSGLRFLVKNIKGGQASVPVVYRGTVPDLFKATRHITVEGQMRNGSFVAVPGSLVTKCPSKYEAAKPAQT